jgi:hypothetical protein
MADFVANVAPKKKKRRKSEWARASERYAV